jgi:hypothetical protein
MRDLFLYKHTDAESFPDFSGSGFPGREEATFHVCVNTPW